MISKKNPKRCSECGARCTRLDENRRCYGCELDAKKKKGLVDSDTEHPAIVKRKRQR